ncbi:MAG: acyltransferase [Planctomycetaceae bacterium]
MQSNLQQRSLISSDTSNRLHYFRILCTSFVVGIHTNSTLTKGGGASVFVSSALDQLYRTAVPGFFLLTGFLLVARADCTVDFFRGRILRILPAWMFWSVVYLFYRVVHHGNQISLISGVRCIIVGDTYYHLWFMYRLLALYLSLPLIRFFCTGAGPRRTMIAAGLCFAVNEVAVDAGRFLSQASGFSCSPALSIPVMDWTVLLAVVGWTVSQHQTEVFSLRRAAAGFGAMFLTLMTLSVYSWWPDGDAAAVTYPNSLVLPMSACLFFTILRLPFALPSNRFVEELSAASFGIYLAHPLILETVVSPFLGAVADVFPMLNTAITFLVTAACILTLRRIPPLKWLC